MANLHDLQTACAQGITSVSDLSLFLRNKEALRASEEQEARELEEATKYSTYDDYACNHR